MLAPGIGWFTLYPNMARISIAPEWAKLIDFETRLPEAVARLIAQHRVTPEPHSDLTELQVQPTTWVS